MSRRPAPPAVEESVACNLIPMIDIMFLLLLFFMLGADMTQREREELRLPGGDACALDDPVAQSGFRRTTLNVFHVPVADSSGRGAVGLCRDPRHWEIAIRGERFPVAEVRARLAEEAALDADPRARESREVLLRADADAPYAVLQRVIEGCAAAGLAHVAVAATRPPLAESGAAGR